MRFPSSPILAIALAALVGALWSPAPAGADEALADRTYHFGTHDARTNMTFVSEADLETIHGVTNKIAGKVTVDEKGTSAKGRLRTPVASLRTGIALRDEHLRSEDWLHAKKHPNIDLQIVEARESEKKGTWTYKADITIKGVTKRFTGKARITPIPDRLGRKLGPGSWVRLRTKFEVKLSAHGIVIPKQIGNKVSDTWDVGVDLYGTTVKPKPEK